MWNAEQHVPHSPLVNGWNSLSSSWQRTAFPQCGTRNDCNNIDGGATMFRAIDRMEFHESDDECGGGGDDDDEEHSMSDEEMFHDVQVCHTTNHHNLMHFQPLHNHHHRHHHHNHLQQQPQQHHEQPQQQLHPLRPQNPVSKFLSSIHVENDIVTPSPRPRLPPPLHNVPHDRYSLESGSPLPLEQRVVAVRLRSRECSPVVSPTIADLGEHHHHQRSVSPLLKRKSPQTVSDVDSSSDISSHLVRVSPLTSQFKNSVSLAERPPVVFTGSLMEAGRVGEFIKRHKGDNGTWRFSAPQ